MLLLEPIDCHIGYAMSVVALFDRSFSVNVKSCVVVFALPFVRNPIVETRAAFVALFAHVPLAYVSCLVTALL